MQGNARYVANEPAERDFSAGRAARAEVQYPIAAVLSCADSRVSPELLFDKGPGEIFVVRLAGNFPPASNKRSSSRARRSSWSLGTRIAARLTRRSRW